MILNADKCEVPDYLDEEFFKRTVSSGLGCTNPKIIQVKISAGSNCGDNYLSKIYRAKVTYTLNGPSVQNICLIIKCVIVNVSTNVLQEANVFVKESAMYQDILPEIEKILGSTKLAPKCYYATTDPASILVFEDMKESDYDMADRVDGLDENHCKAALTKLAKYHAASMILSQKDSSIRNRQLLQKGIYASPMLKKDRLPDYFRQTLKILIEDLNTNPENEELVTKLGNVCHRKFFDRILDAIYVSSDDIVVLNHGDFWINNFLYKYETDSNTPSDSILIDFQGSFFGSLGLDINYFLVTSPRVDILESKKNYLVERIYYSIFKKTLEDVNFQDIPSLEDIKREVDRKVIFAFFCGIMVLPVIAMKRTDATENTLEVFRNEETKSKACKSGRYLQTMRFIVKECDKHGVFDL